MNKKKKKNADDEPRMRTKRSVGEGVLPPSRHEVGKGRATAPKRWKESIEADGGARPYLGVNDLELLFNYFLINSPVTHLRPLWDEAASSDQMDQFLCALARVLSESKLDLNIVRTREDGVKLVTRLNNGFVTSVFDVDF